MKKNTVYLIALITIVVVGFFFLPKPEAVQKMKEVDQAVSTAIVAGAKVGATSFAGRGQPTPKGTPTLFPRQQQALSATPVLTATVQLLVIPQNLPVVLMTMAAAPRATIVSPLSIPSPAQVKQNVAGCGALGPKGKCYCSAACNQGGPPVLVYQGGCNPCTP